MKQNLLRYYMNAWWDNDADCLMLRRQKEMTRGLRLTYGLLSDEEVRTMLVNQYLSCGLFSQTEPLDTVEDDRLMEIRHLLPLMDMQIQPLLFDGNRFPSAVIVAGTGEKRFLEIVFFNWNDGRPITPAFRPADYLECPEGTVLAAEFYSGRFELADSREDFTVSQIPPHSAEIVKLYGYDSSRAYVVGSTGHYSMGEEIRRMEIDGDGDVRIEAELPCGEPVRYRILLPDDGSGNRKVCTKTVQ